MHKELLGDDFHVDIGSNELSKLYITANFKKVGDKYKNISDNFMKPKFN